MEYVIKKFDELTTNELYAILQLRFHVFVLEQESLYDEVDGKDLQCYHLLGYENGELAAYLRILPCGLSFEEVSIGRFVVRPSFRKNGWGRFIMQEAFRFIQNVMHEDKVRIEGQCYLRPFYESLGFKVTSDEFLDGGIPHYEMLWEKVK